MTIERIEKLKEEREKFSVELERARKVVRQIEDNILLVTGAIIEVGQSINDNISSGEKS
jgi:hypothetical protein|tara:strand:- start:652 stop:828 length:177 start_codon:yes stop_codon:yes gene_type:complete